MKKKILIVIAIVISLIVFGLMVFGLFKYLDGSKEVININRYIIYQK